MEYAYKYGDIFTVGVFDLFHFGHAKALEQAKKLYTYVHLTVGVCTDEDTKFYKGKTVMNQAERLESVRHCRYAGLKLWLTRNSFFDILIFLLPVFCSRL